METRKGFIMSKWGLAILLALGVVAGATFAGAAGADKAVDTDKATVDAPAAPVAADTGEVDVEGLKLIGSDSIGGAGGAGGAAGGGGGGAAGGGGADVQVAQY